MPYVAGIGVAHKDEFSAGQPLHQVVEVLFFDIFEHFLTVHQIHFEHHGTEGKVMNHGWEYGIQSVVAYAFGVQCGRAFGVELGGCKAHARADDRHGSVGKVVDL